MQRPPWELCSWKRGKMGAVLEYRGSQTEPAASLLATIHPKRGTGAPSGVDAGGGRWSSFKSCLFFSSPIVEPRLPPPPLFLACACSSFTTHCLCEPHLDHASPEVQKFCAEIRRARGQQFWRTSDNPRSSKDFCWKVGGLK